MPKGSPSFIRHGGLDELDDLSNSVGMTNQQPLWDQIDRVAERLGVKYDARRKWRARGVPHRWRLAIIHESAGSVGPTDFEKLPAPAKQEDAAA